MSAGYFDMDFDGGILLRWRSGGGGLHGAACALTDPASGIECRTMAGTDCDEWTPVFGDDTPKRMTARLAAFTAVAARLDPSGVPFFRTFRLPTCCDDTSHRDVVETFDMVIALFQQRKVQFPGKYFPEQQSYRVLVNLFPLDDAVSASEARDLVGSALIGLARLAPNVSRTRDVSVSMALHAMRELGKLPGGVSVHFNKGMDYGRLEGQAMTTVHYDDGSDTTKAGRIIAMIGGTEEEDEDDIRRMANMVNCNWTCQDGRPQRKSALIILKGGPGSGKTSISMILAARVNGSAVFHADILGTRFLEKLAASKSTFAIADRTNVARKDRAELVECCKDRLVIVLELESELPFRKARVLQRAARRLDNDGVIDDPKRRAEVTKMLNALQVNDQPIEKMGDEKIDVFISMSTDSVETADANAARICASLKKALEKIGYSALAECIDGSDSHGDDDDRSAANLISFFLPQGKGYDRVKVAAWSQKDHEAYEASDFGLGMREFTKDVRIRHEAGPCGRCQAKFVINVHRPDHPNMDSQLIRAIFNENAETEVTDERILRIRSSISRFGPIEELLKDKSARGRTNRFELVKTVLVELEAEFGPGALPTTISTMAEDDLPNESEEDAPARKRPCNDDEPIDWCEMHRDSEYKESDY